jgi:hypothetical protein
MMTFTTLKIHFISIYDPTLLRTWWAKKETWGNCTPWFAHQINGFSISNGHMNKPPIQLQFIFQSGHDYIMIQSMSRAWKQPRLQDFLNQDENKSMFNISNLDCEIRKQE